MAVHADAPLGQRPGGASSRLCCGVPDRCDADQAVADVSWINSVLGAPGKVEAHEQATLPAPTSRFKVDDGRSAKPHRHRVHIEPFGEGDVDAPYLATCSHSSSDQHLSP